MNSTFALDQARSHCPKVTRPPDSPGTRNWVDKNDRLPEQAGYYHVWSRVGLFGHMFPNVFFDGKVFEMHGGNLLVTDWMDGYS